MRKQLHGPHRQPGQERRQAAAQRAAGPCLSAPAISIWTRSRPGWWSWWCCSPAPPSTRGRTSRRYSCSTPTISTKSSRFDSLEELSVWLTGIMHRFISYSFDFTQVKHSDVVYKVMEYVKTNYPPKNITLDDVARTCLSQPLLSQQHLQRGDRRQSLFAYINKVRVDKSKMLSAGQQRWPWWMWPALCGFEDQSYFTKVFKKSGGCLAEKIPGYPRKDLRVV